MSNTFFILFVIAIFVFAIGKTIYYFIEKKKIFESCRQSNSIEIKNISGTIFIDGGNRKRWEWCIFHLLINENSIFLFTVSFGLIPLKIINLLFSNKNRKNTRNPILLREYKIEKNNAVLVYYPDYMIGSKRITLNNLNQEQLLLLEKTLEGKSRRFY
ncbi:hypothetical protein [Chryseobacterium taichungense]|uniref:hypothetical protein n=1 Tax=Chryseobacterium taichungense TaxID=295069 RepID=UPI0028ADADC3|nr:hypothetical protein [Chryseobacterium taichungense]